MPADEDELRERIQAAVVEFIAQTVLYNHAVAQREGLGASDQQFLTLLQVHGPMTAGRLAEMTALTTGTTTGVIDRLERAGFVHRVRDERDRRKVIVQRDERAINDRMAPHYAGYARHLERLLARRDIAEMQVIADFLSELNGAPDSA